MRAAQAAVARGGRTAPDPRRPGLGRVEAAAVVPSGVDTNRLIGAVEVELRYAVAELRSAAARPEAGDRGLLYTLADRLEQTAERLLEALQDGDGMRPAGEDVTTR